MECLEEQTLIALLEGDLPSAERAPVEAHIDACPQCRRAVAALARSDSGPPREAGRDPTRITITPGTRIEHFRVLSRLGQGGMGEVYLAEDSQLRRRVAIKVIRPELVRSPGSARRLIQEARTTALFSHPNIVTIHHVGTHQGLPFLALEYLDGQTLRERVLRGPLDHDELVRVAIAIAEALREAHRHGVLHRDLKPENVMLLGDGRLRVLDFGLSDTGGGPPVAGADPSLSTLSHHRSLRGTPAYMAPEQWRGDACTEATDVWALGVLLHELITGRRPYEERDVPGLRERITDPRPVPPIPAVAPALREVREVCRVCLDKRAAERPRAEEVVESLRASLPAPASRPMGLVFLVLGPLLIFLGAFVVVGMILTWLRGTSQDLGTDLALGAVFGTVPIAGGALALAEGLKRYRGRLFLLIEGGAIAFVGFSVVAGHGLELLKGTSTYPSAFSLVLLATLGLLPLVGGALLAVRGYWRPGGGGGRLPSVVERGAEAYLPTARQAPR